MDERQTPSGWRTAGTIAAVYGAWFVICAVGVGVMVIWHTALLRAYVVLGWDMWGMALFNDTVVLVLVLAWLIFVIAIEGWLRRAAGAGALGRRFVRLLAIMVITGAVGYLLSRVV